MVGRARGIPADIISGWAGSPDQTRHVTTSRCSGVLLQQPTRMPQAQSPPRTKLFEYSTLGLYVPSDVSASRYCFFPRPRDLLSLEESSESSRRTPLVSEYTSLIDHTTGRIDPHSCLACSTGSPWYQYAGRDFNLSQRCTLCPQCAGFHR